MRHERLIVAGALMLVATGALVAFAGLVVKNSCCQNGNFECQGCVQITRWYNMGSPLTPQCVFSQEDEDACEIIGVECWRETNPDYYTDGTCQTYLGTLQGEASRTYSGCDDPGSGTGCD